MKKLLLIILFSYFTFYIFGQEFLGGQVNEYFVVGGIAGTDMVNIDDPDDITGVINEGDIVMLIQMTGQTISTSGNWETSRRELQNIFGTGLYEFLRVESVITAADTFVVFTADLLNSYNAGERMQLIKVPEVDHGIVNSEIAAMDWNGQKGGIVALIANTKLTLNSNINVSGQGFLGGQREFNYTGGCRPAGDTFYFPTSAVNAAGYKGEGVLTTSSPISDHRKGRGHYGNGGGGGNGYFSGGGGGSNSGAGGSGGNQIQICGVPLTAEGGEPFDLSDEINNKRVIMGGGGGAGTENTDTAGTAGEDGGGIVFIITDTLEGYSNYIYANGASVPGTALAGAGGGGGGGSVYLDVTTYEGMLNVHVRGGNGGNTGGYCTGPGGGGGGGTIWYSGSEQDFSLDTTGGSGGNGCLNAFDGKNGTAFNSLISQVNGFMFNFITLADTLICQGQRPDTIFASMPRGGDGSYSYDWEMSPDNSSWGPASGDAGLRFFRPDALDQSRYFRRVISSDGQTDISKSVRVHVYPEISNNILNLRDTICNMDVPGLLGAESVSGGNNIYQYNWFSSTNGTIWSFRTNDSLLTESNPLIQNTFYYRRVTSAGGLCENISEIDTISVFTAVSGNNITTADHNICGAGLPDPLIGSLPGEGDDIYSFLWEYSENNGVSWDTVAGTYNDTDYTPGAISLTTLFRRKAGYDLCPEISDISDPVAVTVYNPIANNTIDNTIPIYTCYDSPAELDGSSNLTGANGEYEYFWEYSPNGTAWEDGSLPNNQEDFSSRDITVTSYFRRIVKSGENNECIDTSIVAEVFIHPLPVGDIVDGEDTICAGENVSVDYNVTGNGPWNITIGEGDVNTTQQVSGASGSIDITLGSNTNISMLSVEDANGCFADLSGNTGVFEAIVYEIPVPDAGTYGGACGLIIDLNAEPSVGQGIWSGPYESISDERDANAAIGVSDYGEYMFTWTETNWECTAYEDVSITFYEQPDYAYAGEDSVLEYTFATYINAGIPEIGQGTWSAESELVTFEDPDSESTRVQLPDVGEYNLYWTVENGVCVPVVDSLVITVTDLVVEKGFSPNGDGFNDVFMIELGDAQNAELVIFNRWGKIVYENRNYTEGDYWDGTSLNGDDLPEDTYFYIFKFDNGRVLKRFVELRR